MAAGNNQHAYHDAMTPKGRFRHGRSLDYVIAALIVLTVFIQGTYTIHRIGICWDEPSQYHIAKGYVEWLLNVDKDASFSSKTLERTFGFKPHYNDHPTLPKIISATTYALLRNLMGDFWAYRVSAPLLFGILLAVLYLRLAHAQSRLSGLAATLCLAMMPRMFTHGHIGVTDAPLCLFWFLAIWAFENSCDRPWFSPLAGVAFGLCMSVKFTGILLAIPLIIWGSIYRRRSMIAPTACLLIGIPIFLLLNPSMWDHPVKEFWAFVQMSTTRAAWNAHWMVFLGRIYEFSPPWFYAPFMVFVTIPEITAALFATGFGVAICNRLRDSLSGSAVIHFSFLMIITMHPNAPIFNGVRLFLPAFVFVAVIAGMGCDRVARWVTQYVQQRRPVLSPRKGYQWITAVTVALLLITSATPLIGIYPYGLEYYNTFVGRIKGARKLGLETTYWWTVVNKDALSRLNRILPKDSSIQFIPTEPDLYNLYKEVGLLREDITIVDNFDCDYLLLLCWPYWNFPGFFMAKLGVPQWQLRVIDFLAVDNVPFWIVYENPRR